MASLFGNIFSNSDDSVLGIDIGSSAIKVVQIRKKRNQAVLETYGELSLGPYAQGHVGQAVMLPAEKIAEALSDLLKEKEVNVTTKRCGVSIPFASSLMSVFEIPQVSDKELATMVPLEARKYIPVPISEVMLDWSVIPRDEIIHDEEPTTSNKQPTTGVATPNIPKMDVLVVAIHNDTIARYKEIVEKAGLEASFFEIEIFSTMRSVLPEVLAPIMIMDMGAASTKVYIVERGIIKVSHTINRGAQDITGNLSKSLGLPVDRAEVLKRDVGLTGEDKSFAEVISLTLDHIFAEASQTLLSYEKKYNKAVSQVILVGGGASLKGLASLAKESFKTETVPGDPFGKLAAPVFLENILKETGPEFAVAIGVALRKLAEDE